MQHAIRLIRSPNLPLLLFAVCFLGVAGFFHDAASGLASLWVRFDESLGHGLLVLAVSLFLIGRALLNRTATSVSPAWAAAVPLFVASLLTVFSGVIGVELIQYVLLPAMVVLAFTLVAGSAQARRVLVPLGMLYFAVPVWDYLNDTLLAMTVAVVQYLVRLSGITAYISGNSIFTPYGEITIAYGCSGLRYFIIGTLLGLLGAYLNNLSWLRSLLVMALAAVLALLANWVRVYGVTLIAYFSEMQSGLVNDHEMLGWVVFLLFMLPLFYLTGRTGNPDREDNSGSGVRETAGVSASKPGQNQPGRLLAALVLLGLTLAGGPLLLQTLHATTTDIPELARLPSPVKARPVEGDYTPGPGDWQPQIRRPEMATIKRYGKQAEAVIVYRYLYHRENSGEIIPYAVNLYGRDNWAVTAARDEHGFRYLELYHKTTQERVVVFYRFNVGGYTTDSYLLAKAYQFPAVLARRPYAVFTALSARCQEDCSQTQSRVLELLDLEGD